MSEELEETGGLSRRSMIKRGAIVGGTLVWAQPVVQGFGTPAGAQSPSPLTGFSYIAVTFTCDGTDYYAKYELDEDVWEDEPGSTPDCNAPTGWGSGTAIGGDNADALIDVVQTDSTITLTLLCAGGTFTDGVIKQGSDTSTDQACASGVAVGNTISFDNNDVGPDSD